MPVKSLMFTPHGTATPLQGERARILSVAFHAVMTMQLVDDAVEQGMQTKEAYARAFSTLAGHLMALHKSGGVACDEILSIAEADSLNTLDWFQKPTEVLQ